MLSIDQGATSPEPQSQDRNNPSLYVQEGDLHPTAVEPLNQGGGGNGRGGLRTSSRNNPCPVCGRTKDGDCRIGSDGLVLCHSNLDAKFGDTSNDGLHRCLGKSRNDPKGSTAWKPASQWKEKRAEGTHRFTYRLWNGNPAPADRIRRDSGNGQEKSIRWERMLNGTPEADIAPYRWHDALALLDHHDTPPVLLIVKGELKADGLHRMGLPTISILSGQAHIQNLLQRLSDINVSPVLAPDCDRADLDGWYQDIAKALPNCQHLHYPGEWNNPPSNGGRGPEDWLSTDRPSQEDVLYAIGTDPLVAITPGTNGHKQNSGDQPSGFTPKPGSTARWGKRNLSHSKREQCFKRCVEVQSARICNQLSRRARLLKAIKDLGLSGTYNRQEIAQMVLEAKDKHNGYSFRLISAADRAAMERPKVEWLFRDLIPLNDLTILGGRPKVGKSRLSTAITAAALTASGIMGFEGQSESVPVILVTDDQADGDTADNLESLGVWHHPQLFWSRHFRLTETDLDALMQAIREHPGALVILDSLRSIGRSNAAGENDPEMGALLYDLKAAVIKEGGTLLLIHHCNKSEDLVGTEALSGHNAIAGAANTVLTFHYLSAKGSPVNKDDKRRRLVREARSGIGFDIIVTAESGQYQCLGTYADWLENQQQAEAIQQKQSSITEEQETVLSFVNAAGGQWVTLRDVSDHLGLEWTGPSSPDAKRVRRGLQRLSELRLIQKGRAGNELTFARLDKEEEKPYPSRALGNMGNPVNPPQGKGSGVSEPMGNRGKLGKPLAAEGICSPARPDENQGGEAPVIGDEKAESPEPCPQQGFTGFPMVSHSMETPETQSPTGVSHVSLVSHQEMASTISDSSPSDEPAWLPRLRQLAEEHPGRSAARLSQQLSNEFHQDIKGSEISRWL